ncbi:GNAT family N-acetyltransferase [Magnetospirillum sulfuroxidans]|uniref:GNAT family N-acetyltransferase n=1 Tax=Magnetospirillum sulfuroxidans TaxID=611300 RepID=A0ABS5IA40_9PROT|nr:GNAT family N-acetyltransferase [Magnetospirillum sulfuroxidans]MBR9971301.1 GNAT family N-acetyltransferase [Magnetospirillum sulfuroxidans]
MTGTWLAEALLLTAVDANPPPSPFALRPITLPADLAFLLDLYRQSRAREMALVPWPEEHKRAFLSQQFTAQHFDYENRFVQRRFCLVLRQGKPIGRLYLAETSPGRLRVVDISLVTKMQGRGCGTLLLRWLINLCEGAGAGVELHVQQGNPARRLYQRLGFVQTTASHGPYDFMCLEPAAIAVS